MTYPHQSDCDELSSEQFDELEDQIKALEEEAKDLTAKQKQITAGVTTVAIRLSYKQA